MENERLLECISDRLLQLIILPTEACNFRCVYCYETFEIGKMKRPVITGILALIKKRLPDLNRLVLSWFGGEPLLAVDVIQAISEQVLSVLPNYPRVRYYADMSTNGYVLDTELFQRLLGWNIRTYQISFDGPEEVHDRKRISRKW